MAIHNVKCPYCEKRFSANDKDENVLWVKVGRRYAHIECYNRGSEEQRQEEAGYDELWQYVKKLDKDVNYQIFKRQFEKIKKEHPTYTSSGMKKALQWFYEVEKKPVLNGSLGIIPYVYDSAYKYYYNLFLIQKRNENIEMRTPVREIQIQSPRMYRPEPQLWNFDDEEDDNIEEE